MNEERKQQYLGFGRAGSSSSGSVSPDYLKRPGLPRWRLGLAVVVDGELVEGADGESALAAADVAVLRALESVLAVLNGAPGGLRDLLLLRVGHGMDGGRRRGGGAMRWSDGWLVVVAFFFDGITVCFLC